MKCDECKEKKYTRIIIGVTERYFCEDCYKEYMKNQRRRHGKFQRSI